MAKAKKKTTETTMGVQITPNPKNVKVGVDFDDLNEGEYFIMGGELWQKADDCATCQGASNAITGEMREDLCEEKVIPVTVTITWEVK